MRATMILIVPGRVIRIDLCDIACLTLQLRGIFRLKRQVIAEATDAAFIDERSLNEAPTFVSSNLPIRNIQRAADDTKLMLPVTQSPFITVVDLDHVEQRSCALSSQPI